MSLASDAVVVCKHAANARPGRHGSASTTGALDLDDRILEDGSGMQIRERVRLWRVPAHHLPTVARGSTVVLTNADGTETSYRVREIEMANGGGVKELTLAEA